MRIRRHRKIQPSASSGFSLLEILISSVVLVIAVGSSLASMVTYHDLAESDRELVLAYAEAERMIEEIRSQNFADVFAMYNSTSKDDPVGVAPGANFDVVGLTGCDGASVGSITFPVIDGNEGFLREDLDMPELGLPRDLNGDGLVDGNDHSADMILLPMMVQLDWSSRGGTRTVQIPVYLYNTQQ